MSRSKIKVKVTRDKNGVSADISGIAEVICTKFTWKTCLVLRSDEFEGHGQFRQLAYGLFGKKHNTIALVMAALCNSAVHYIFALWFLSFFLFFFLSFFFSSPNLSGRRLDAYHTSAPGVALVRIWNAGLKCAARGSLQIQDAKKSPKNRHLGAIPQLCWAISSQLKHVSTIGKKLVKQQYVLHMYS